MREALDAQSSLSKRQRAEMEAMAHEMCALKVLLIKCSLLLSHAEMGKKIGLRLIPEVHPMGSRNLQDSVFHYCIICSFHKVIIQVLSNLLLKPK